MSCPPTQVLVALVERTLPPAQAADLEAHLGACSTCRGVVNTALASGETAAGTPPPYAPAAPAPASADLQLGDRYVVAHLLGRGGMGAVYLARDLTLGRDVAVKLHGAGSGSDRLHREAIAMAKLAHPNVVTVFEVASFEDRLYVAMEYVRGGTVRSWLASQPRGWREIVELLLGAGEGLAAAHAAGLIHRDFKPENVLVGEDGRPRVGDFGIAHLGERDAAQIISLVPDSDVTTPLTITGSVLGTPVYMAPEQLAGDPVDARADQFAFCVTAWECLFGERPFRGNTIAALAVAIERQVLARPSKTEVPPRVIEVLERGLVWDVAQRHADMPTLLAALRAASAPPRPRRTRWVAIGGGAAAVALAVVVTAVATRAAERGADPCAVPADALAGAWTPAIEEALRTAFVAARPADGLEIAGRTREVLAGYATAWSRERRLACEATHSRAEQSGEALDLRMACLDRKRAELAGLTQLLGAADAKVTMGAVRAAHGLSALEACRDVVALSAPVRPPTEDVRARVEVLRTELAGARSLRLLGQLQPALAKAEAVRAGARDLAYRPLDAEALLMVGELTEQLGDTAAGIKLLEQAIVAANAGNHRLIAAEAWASLAWTLGYRERNFERGMTAVQMAASSIEGAGGNAALTAQLMNYEALILETGGKRAEGRARYLEALAAYEQMPTHDEVKISLVLNDLGGLERKLGNFDAAEKHLARALAIRLRLFGTNHPFVFSSLTNLGNVAWSRGDHAAAERSFLRALAVAEAVFPAQHPQTALVLSNLAAAYDHQDKLDEALAMARRALAMTEALRGPAHADVADGLKQLASIHTSRAEAALAITALERALAILAEAPDDGLLLKVLLDLGQQLIPREPARAEELLQRALAMGEQAAPAHPDLAYPLTALGELYATTRRPGLARTQLERALALRAGTEDDDPEATATAELLLAEVLWPTPARRARAVELAQRARQRLEAADEAGGKLHRRVVAWLAAHAR